MSVCILRIYIEGQKIFKEEIMDDETWVEIMIRSIMQKIEAIKNEKNSIIVSPVLNEIFQELKKCEELDKEENPEFYDYVRIRLERFALALNAPGTEG